MRSCPADLDGRADSRRGPTVVGVVPWLPWPLSASRWWTGPVRAERLAALRIGLAAILLIDLLLTYVPNLHVFYGKGSLGDPALFEYHFEAPRWTWSVLRGVESPTWLGLALVLWVVAAVFMLLGFWTRLSVVIVWVLSISFNNINDFNNNAGDDLRNIALFYLMLCPCGAVWSVDAVLRRWRGKGRRGPVYVPPWPLRLLLIQMALTYFCNGIFKVFGKDWQEGNSLYYVLNDLTLARWSYAQFHLPLWLTRRAAWTVLAWELTFPLVLLLPGVVAVLFGPWLRKFLDLPRRLTYLRRSGKLSPGRAAALRRLFRLPVVGFLFGSTRRLRRGYLILLPWFRGLRVLYLVFGVLFHLGIFITMELGFFGLYMVILYLPLLPWERWADRRRPVPAPTEQRFLPYDVELVEPANVPLVTSIK